MRSMTWRVTSARPYATDAKEFPGSDPATLGKALPMEMVRPRRTVSPNTGTVSSTLERLCEHYDGFANAGTVSRTLERFRGRHRMP